MDKPFHPRRAIIEVTHRCNLRCVTCNRWKSEQSGPPFNQVMDTHRTLVSLGIERVTYLGAEPFLRADLLNLAQDAKGLGLKTAVVTNGTLLTDLKIDRILEEDLLDVLIFSIDGPEEVHDAIRGIEGAFAKAARAINRLQKQKKQLGKKRPKVKMYSTISSGNAHCVRAIFDVAKKLDVSALRFVSASAVTREIMEDTNNHLGEEAINSHSYAIDPALAIRADQREMVSTELFSIAALGKKIGVLVEAEALLENGRGASACPFVGKDLIIDAEGEVCPCPMLPRYNLGNIHDSDASELFVGEQPKARLAVLTSALKNGGLPICRQCCVSKLALPEPAPFKLEESSESLSASIP